MEAEVGKHVVMAREAGNGDWYIGAMAGPDAVAFDVSLDFLPEGQWQACVWEDGVNAQKNAEDFAIRTYDVDNGDILKINMCNEGGFAAILKPVR